jgi:putative transcriptional regulator
MNHDLDFLTQVEELTPGSLRDHFLIAMPGMADPSFSHTVTYICEHSDKGAMGVVINTTTPMQLKEIFAQMQLEDNASHGEQIIMAGGPVQPERGFVLHSGETQWQTTLKVSDEISLTVSRDIIAAMAEGNGPQDFLISLGYAGWGEGQLESEIAANSWLTVPADKNIIFHTPVDKRWAQAARSLGIDLQLMSGSAGHA